jgi:DNA polymerase I-like protein with 3'-5' exonuclease and polymerase domains
MKRPPHPFDLHHPKLVYLLPGDEVPTSLRESKIVAIDVETDKYGITMVSWCGSAEPMTAYCFDWYLPNCRLVLHEVLEDPCVIKVGHNFKFDWKVLHRDYHSKPENFICTRVLWHLLDENSSDASKIVAIKPSLKALFQMVGGPYYSAPLDKYLLGSKKKSKNKKKKEEEEEEEEEEEKDDIPFPSPPPNWDSIPPDILRAYSAWDAFASYHLFQILWSMLPANLRSHARILMEVERELCQIEVDGMALDKEGLSCAYDGCLEELSLVQTCLHHWLGPSFNVRSQPMVAQALYDPLPGCPPRLGGKLPILSKTPGGKPSVDEATLLKLQEQFPDHVLLENILRFRQLDDKRKKLEFYQKNLDPDGKLHPTFKLYGTRTGRLSSVPNVQNVTRQGGIRDLFTSEFE